MFSPLRNRFGIPGVISVIALVFAMFGGAYAATNGSGGGKASVSAKAKRGPRGPKGPAGPAGPQGPAGSQGAAGSNGKDGAPGKSIVVSEIEAEEEGCEERGGAEVKQEGAGEGIEVCNGAEGEPWTAGGTLPKGSSETGAFSPSQVPTLLGIFEAPGYVEASQYLLPVDFPIRLANAPAFVYVPAAGQAFGTAAGCPGVVGGVPKANSGKFCVYVAGDSVEEGAFGFPSAAVVALRPDAPMTQAPGTPGTSRSGAILKVSCAEVCVGAGLWAATG